MRIHKSGHEICSVEDWRQWAGPKKGDLHWKDGRSAKELARSWFRLQAPAPPEELRLLMEKHFGTGILFEEGKPECIIPLDDFQGEQRNCDLVVLCRTESQRIAVNIEAKVDEPFGEKVIGAYYDQTLNTRSNVPKRIEQLSLALFGRKPDSVIRGLRYQLLHSTAAALIEATERQTICALFLVHEFHSSNLNLERITQNVTDWISFVYAFSALESATVEKNQILGPVLVPGNGRVPSSIPLYLGNLVTRLPATT